MGNNEILEIDVAKDTELLKQITENIATNSKDNDTPIPDIDALKMRPLSWLFTVNQHIIYTKY